MKCGPGGTESINFIKSISIAGLVINCYEMCYSKAHMSPGTPAVFIIAWSANQKKTTIFFNETDRNILAICFYFH